MTIQYISHYYESGKKKRNESGIDMRTAACHLAEGYIKPVMNLVDALRWN